MLPTNSHHCLQCLYQVHVGKTTQTVPPIVRAGLIFVMSSILEPDLTTPLLSCNKNNVFIRENQVVILHVSFIFVPKFWKKLGSNNNGNTMSESAVTKNVRSGLNTPPWHLLYKELKDRITQFLSQTLTEHYTI